MGRFANYARSEATQRYRLRRPRFAHRRFPDDLRLHWDEHPAWLQGKSILPVLSGQTAEIHEEVFAEVNYHASYEPKRAVRTTRWKYIRRFGDRRTPVLPNCDDSPSKDLWLQAGWGSQILDTESLYDLLFDPTEHANLVNDPAHLAVASDMRARLHAWMVS